MKIIRIASLTASLMAAVSVFGQVKAKYGFTMGANLNMPSYSMSGDSLAGADKISSLGGHGGFYNYANLSGKNNTFGLQSEVLFSVRSHNTNSKETFVAHEEINYYRESFAFQQMMYVDAPIHFRYNINFQKGRYGDVNALSVLVGPQTSMAVGRKYSVEHTYVTTLLDQETIQRETSNKATFDYRPFEVGISAGLQLELDFGLRTGFRYYRSFMNVADHESLKIINQMMLFYVGYNFVTIKKSR